MNFDPALQLSEELGAATTKTNGLANKLEVGDHPVHGWYRFVLSFPPHLVRQYLERFGLKAGEVVLDPFCGTGTTLVEAMKLGFNSIGVENNPVAHFASFTKTSWNTDGNVLRTAASSIYEEAQLRLRSARKLRTFTENELDLLLENCLCPIPMHKLLILRECIQSSTSSELSHYFAIALAKIAVQTASNLHFGPEVGVKGKKIDAPVLDSWIDEVKRIAGDLDAQARTPALATSRVIRGDARGVPLEIENASVDAVFTSPPYPNEKDYTRATRLESVLLEFLSCKADLRQLKQGLLRSNTRNVYKEDRDDDWVTGIESVALLVHKIEGLRISLNKTSGFEKLYGRVTKLYFGGMARHLQDLKRVLKPGAKLGYVVGDQASFFRVHIRTGELLAEIAEAQGYKVLGLDLFRTRLATATRQQMREEVLLLEMPTRT